MKLTSFVIAFLAYFSCLATTEAGELSPINLIKAPQAAANDKFGAAIDISGETLAIGAPERNGHGSVLIYQWVSGQWEFSQEISATNKSQGDRFGTSLDLHGDRLIVGAPDQSGTAADPSSDELILSGAAYIFTRTNGSWTQSAYLKASNAEPSDGFGNAVAIEGNYAAVGAPFEQSLSSSPSDNSAFSGAGAVYLFEFQAPNWTQSAYLKAPHPTELDDFGAQVDISGDQLAIGAPGESSNAQSINGNQQNESAFASGAVFLFKRNTTWQLDTYFKSSNSTAGDAFGDALDLEGARLAVSARGDDSSNLVNSGAVHFFEKPAGSWRQTATLKAPNADANDNFGQRLDLDADQIVISTTSEKSQATGINGNRSDNSLSQAGAAYLFEFNDNQWKFTDYLKATNTGAGDRFGTAVALADGKISVSADGEDSNASLDQETGAFESGAIYTTILSPAGFASWATQQGLSGDDALPNADPNGTGLVNLTRYALNLSPGQIAQFTREPTGKLTLMIPQPARPDIRYQWRSSSDLKQWEPIATLQPDGTLTGNTQLITTTVESPSWLKVSIEQPQSSANQNFIQLYIELIAN